MIRTTYGLDRYFTGEYDAVFGTARSWAGAQSAGVVFCHGANESATIAYADNAQRAIMRGVGLNATVHVGDLGGTNTWGNDTAIARVEDAVTYLRSGWGQGGPVVLVGISMGNLSAMAYALANPDDVAAIASVIPALDLNDLVTNRGMGAAINPAYGGAYNDGTDGPTHSPVLFAADLPAVPIKLWYASDDPLCVASTVTAFVAARPSTVTVNVGALGHSDAAVAAAVDGVVDFVDSVTGA